MCGITALLAPGADLEGQTARMTDAIRHRGPDDAGCWTDPTVGIALGHRRLSVLDLSPAGHQPMTSHDGRWVLAYNGEIYNHAALRAQLEQETGPRRWRGHSDTETILECITAWGVSRTVRAAVGMFAIILWDRRDRMLTLVRDRFGEKPLYYGWTRGRFVAASELDAIRAVDGFDASVDRDVVASYLRLAYVPAPYAIFTGVYNLEPATIRTFALDDTGRITSSEPHDVVSPGRSVEVYWSLRESALLGHEALITDPAVALDELDRTLGEAVRLQSLADVPVGAFLSGGIDSSTIVALMQRQSTRPVRTFTIGFAEGDYNEAEHAKAVAAHLGTEHTELYLSPREARDVIPELPAIYAEPFADGSQIPTFLVSRMARRDVTVALSGDGGDELFAGYNRYSWGPRIWDRIAWMPRGARQALGAAIVAVPVGAWDAAARLAPRTRRVPQIGDKAHKLAARLRSIRTDDDLYRSLVTQWSSTDGVVTGARERRSSLDDPSVVAGITGRVERMMLWDSLTYLPDDILHKVDRAAMHVSLETRVPFLDHRVAALAWRLPTAMKLQGATGKVIIRRLLARYVPPALTERPKTGFGVPLGAWLRRELREWAGDLLGADRLRASGLLDVVAVQRLWAEHLGGRRDHTERLWRVLMLQAWLARGSRRG